MVKYPTPALFFFGPFPGMMELNSLCLVIAFLILNYTDLLGVLRKHHEHDISNLKRAFQGLSSEGFCEYDTKGILRFI